MNKENPPSVHFLMDEEALAYMGKDSKHAEWLKWFDLNSDSSLRN